MFTSSMGELTSSSVGAPLSVVVVWTRLDSTIAYKNPRQLLERNLSLQSHVPTSHNKPTRRARRQTANGRWVMRAVAGAYFMAEGRKNQRVGRSSSGREDETMSMAMSMVRVTATGRDEGGGGVGGSSRDTMAQAVNLTDKNNNPRRQLHASSTERRSLLGR